MTNRFDINRSQRGIPAFSVLLIMAALAVIGVAMLPMLNVQYTPLSRRTENRRLLHVARRLGALDRTERHFPHRGSPFGDHGQRKRLVTLVQRKRSRHHSFPQGDGNGSSPVRSGVGDPEPLP